MRRTLAFVLSAGLVGAGLVSASRALAQPAEAPASAGTLSRAERETFLKEARIIRERAANKGITGTVRATLSDGRFTHDASIQTIDEFRATYAPTGEVNFRDSWKYNLAAYYLDQWLGLDMIPVTVERRYQNKDASFTWWVDDVMMDESARLKKKVRPPDTLAWNRQMATLRLFDQLIYNVDRNLGNVLIASDWKIWMIDHTRAFRWRKAIAAPKNLTLCDRRLLLKLRALDKPTLERIVGDYLTGPEIEGVLTRAGLIADHFEKAGDTALFDGRSPQ